MVFVTSTSEIRTMAGYYKRRYLHGHKLQDANTKFNDNIWWFRTYYEVRNTRTDGRTHTWLWYSI